MEIRQLEAFAAVAEERSFTRAAERLHLVQSAVSASVKALERELGVPLFARSSRAVELTAEGGALLPATRAVLAGLREVKDVAASLVGRVHGSIRFGLLAAPDVADVAGSIARFRERYPEVTLQARTSAEGVGGLFDGLLDESLDLSLVALPLPQPYPGIEVEVLRSGAYVLAAPATHPLATQGSVAPHQLRDAEFVMMPQSFSLRHVLDGWLAQAGIDRPRVAAELGDVQLVAAYVRAGNGVGMLPDVTARSTPGIVALTVPGFELQWSMGLATKRGRRPAAATLLLMELIRESAAAQP